MNEDELKKAVKSEPFVPVRIHVSNGATFEVKHPGDILIGLNSRPSSQPRSGEGV